VFASLVVQILLTMLGFGIGLLAIDVPTRSRRLRVPAGRHSFGGQCQASSPRLSAVRSQPPIRPIRLV
jgi:hypothetical protein